MDATLYVSWGFGNVRDVFIVKGIYNSDVALKTKSTQIERAANILQAWTLRREAKCLSNITTTGLLTVDPVYVSELAQIGQEIREFTDLAYSFGIGLDINESQLALEFAIKRDQILALYAEVVAAEQEPQDPLEEVEKSESLDQILGVLEIISKNLPTIADPVAARSMGVLASTLLKMAKSLAEEPLQKGRTKLPMPKRTPLKIEAKFPDVPAGHAAAGTIKDGKIKVKPVDPETGQALPQKWNSASAGMVRGPENTAVSSRKQGQ